MGAFGAVVCHTAKLFGGSVPGLDLSVAGRVTAESDAGVGGASPDPHLRLDAK
jgi:hypothetical protein